MLMNVAQIHVSHIPFVWIIPWIDENCSVNSGILVFLNKQYLSTCDISSTCWTRLQYNWVFAQYYAIWSTHFMLNNYLSYYSRWVMKQWEDINQDIFVSSLSNLLEKYGILSSEFIHIQYPGDERVNVDYLFSKHQSAVLPDPSALSWQMCYQLFPVHKEQNIRSRAHIKSKQIGFHIIVNFTINLTVKLKLYGNLNLFPSQRS